jgi:hypothetical protein
MPAPNSREILSSPAPGSDAPWERSRKELAALERAGTYIVTSAQNNTEPDSGFLDALKVFCNERDAKLIIIPCRYKNPTQRYDPSEEGEGGMWWHPELRPFLVEQEIRVHPKLAIMGQVRIQATSPRPIGDRLFGRSQDRSAIYGHPQLAMASAPGRGPKLIYSTGAVTRQNYSTTLTGDLAQFHHTLAAVVLEVRGKRYHIREVTWDGKAFYDLDRIYTAHGSKDAPRSLALITGDTHARFTDPDVLGATYEVPESICGVLKPEALIWHDVFDGFSVNPYMDRLREAAMVQFGYDRVSDELDHLCALISRCTPRDSQSIIVRSNHHTWLDRWIRSGASSPANLRLWHELSLAILAEAKSGPAGPEFPDPLEWYCRRAGLKARFLKENEPFEVAGIELSMHGHTGPDGRRGTARGLSSLGYRSVVGHSHSPRIDRGVYQVGTSSRLRLNYNEGPSSWSHTHCVIHANGKRQMIHILGGHWRG